MNSLSIKTFRATLLLSLGIAAGTLLLSCADQAPATESPQKKAQISKEAAHVDYSENWWRGVRITTWLWEGADADVLTATLNRIASAKGARVYPDLLDTIIEYGPGNWNYEFSASGDAAYRQAKESENQGDRLAARNYFLQSSYYYSHAGYPHLREKYARIALNKAFEAYAQAGRLFEVPLEVWDMTVEGVSFKAMVHWPVNVREDDPVPVVLRTSGLDLLSTGFYQNSKTLGDLGAAMITFDIPGTGNDGVLDANIDKHHVAILEHVLKDPRFDKEHIAVWSESVGGWTGARMAFDYSEHLVASIAACGLVHQIFTQGLVPSGPEGDKVRVLLEAYRNGELSRQEIDAFNRKANEQTGQQDQGRNFQAVAFLDRIRSSPGDFLDILSKTLPMSLVEQGYIGPDKKNITETPLLVINTSNDPIVPQAESMWVAQASSRGQLELFDDHAGHCVSNVVDTATSIKWMSQYMGFSEGKKR
ncbi:MAG TPA: alpha/beta hydrolase [Gammaproteobacteria bacterium]|nr:alpha/beta hydrolase [Gammaproteobacteria bacterium]